MEQAAELEFTRWVRVVRRRKKVVVGTAVVLALLGLLAASARGRTYTARASVLVQPALTDATADPAANQTAVQDLSQLATSDIVRAQALAQVGSGVSLAAKTAQGGQIVQFSAKAGSARTAASAANAYAQKFLSMSRANIAQQYSVATDALQGEIGQLEQAIAKLPSGSTELAQLRARRAAYVDALNTMSLRAALAPTGGGRLLSPAAVPSSPDSSSVATYLLAFALVGLLLGAILAAALEARDDRVQEPEDVRPLLPAGREGEPPTSVLQLRSPAEADAYTVLRAALEQVVPGPPVVLLVANASGERRSTTAIEPAAQLAKAFARAGWRTLLAPLDLRRPIGPEQLAALVPVTPPSGRRSRLGLGSAGAVDLSPAKGLGELTVVTSSPFASPDELLDSDTVGALVDGLTRAAEVVVVAAPAVNDVPDALLLAARSDHTIVVVDRALTHRSDVEAAVSRLAGAGGGPTSLLLMATQGEGSRHNAAAAWLGPSPARGPVVAPGRGVEVDEASQLAMPGFGEPQGNGEGPWAGYAGNGDGGSRAAAGGGR